MTHVNLLNDKSLKIFNEKSFYSRNIKIPTRFAMNSVRKRNFRSIQPNYSFANRCKTKICLRSTETGTLLIIYIFSIFSPPLKALLSIFDMKLLLRLRFRRLINFSNSPIFFISVILFSCNFSSVTNIGNSAGICVKPRLLQSTMVPSQEHASGHS